MTGVRAADTQPIDPQPVLLTCPRCDKLYPSDAVHVSRCSGIPVIPARSYTVTAYQPKPLRYACPSCDQHYRTKKGLVVHFTAKHPVAA